MVFRRSAALNLVACWLVAVVLIAEWPLAVSLSSRHLAQSLRLSHDSAVSVLGGGSGTPARGLPAKMPSCPICQAVLTGHAVLPDSVPQFYPALVGAPSHVPPSAVLAGLAHMGPHLPRGPPQA